MKQRVTARHKLYVIPADWVTTGPYAEENERLFMEQRVAKTCDTTVGQVARPTINRLKPRKFMD